MADSAVLIFKRQRGRTDCALLLPRIGNVQDAPDARAAKVTQVRPARSAGDIVGHLSCLDKKPDKAFRFRGAHLKFSGLSPAERDAVADIVTINPFATARGLPY